jgi:uncharacterized membrane protein YeaQ/YmgE (transglycosylase-associated protein family)
MGLLVLIVVGALLGWLATIVMRLEERQDILLNIAVGATGALVAGVLTNPGSILGALSSTALLASLGGAIMLLAVVNWVKRGVLR